MSEYKRFTVEEYAALSREELFKIKEELSDEYIELVGKVVENDDFLDIFYGDIANHDASTRVEFLGVSWKFLEKWRRYKKLLEESEKKGDYLVLRGIPYFPGVLRKGNALEINEVKAIEDSDRKLAGAVSITQTNDLEGRLSLKE